MDQLGTICGSNRSGRQFYRKTLVLRFTVTPNAIAALPPRVTFRDSHLGNQIVCREKSCCFQQVRILPGAWSLPSEALGAVQGGNELD